jgi:hypothetical protein
VDAGVTPQPRPDYDLDERAPWESEPVALSSWEPVDLAPVLRGERGTPAPSVLEREDGVRLLYPARLNLFAGETESMKTWAALVAARQELAAGRHVVFIDFEDTPESGVERLRALGASADEIAGHLTYLRPDGPFDELAQAVMADRIAQVGPVSLAIVDSITEGMFQAGLDPNRGPDVTAFYGGFPRWFSRTGAAVVLVDHVTKSAEGRGRWAIGSERKLSGLDGAAYAFDTVAPFGRERTGKVKITVSKDRCGHVRQREGAGRVIAVLELQSWPDGGVTSTLGVPEKVQEGTFRPTVLMGRLSEAIEHNPGLTSRALRSAVRGKNDAKDLALELLVNEGFVAVEAGPRGARLHHSRRPFGASDEEHDVDDF